MKRTDLKTTRLDHSLETTMTAAIDDVAAAAAPSADCQLVDFSQVMTEAPGGDEAPASAQEAPAEAIQPEVTTEHAAAPAPALDASKEVCLFLPCLLLQIFCGSVLRTVFKFGAFCLCSACGGARIC